MVSDSVLNGSAPAISKDFGKKKRNNRTAKLKQCKLDARRQQWLSQVKNKGSKEESNGGVVSPPSSLPQNDKRKRSLENLETRVSCLNDSDLESLANSPTRSISEASDSRKDRPGSSSSGSSRSSYSSGCYSGSVSDEEEEEEDDDGCLDDWEAIADALTADDDDKRNLPNSVPIEEPKTPVGSIATLGGENLKLDCKGTVSRVSSNGRAWRADDAFRPQSLPDLSKQHSFPMNAVRNCGRGGVTWACHNINSPPSSCPICYEDLDLTDSSFQPCMCGFRLCLFCHKKILEADGRCPGCRKQYDPSIGDKGVNGDIMPIRLARSCSMDTKF